MIRIAHTEGGSVTTVLHTKEDALHRASSAVDQMHRDGVASSIRSVEVRQWGDWDRDKLAYRCPPLFQASLTDMRPPTA